jgi:hypothetical protein
MTAVRPSTRAALLAAAAACAASCTILNIVRQTEGWTLTLQRASDGPNYVKPAGFTAYKPPHGARFINLYLVIKNDAGEARWFGYDSCAVDLDNEWLVPSLVTSYMGLLVKINGNEEYSAGESSHRMLTYAYPKGRSPTRARCGGAIFELTEILR